MTDRITYTRRTGKSLLTTYDIADVFTDWRGSDERWLFLAPHDDDIVAGAGLTFQVGLAEGVDVHALVVTDGRMGYCRMEQRESIAAIRAAETRRSFSLLGLPADRLRTLGYADGDLNASRGRRLSSRGCPTEIQGATGLQNSLTYHLRQIRPNRLFLPSSADYHPDHRVTHEELIISLFHAQGCIWPELGEPIAEVPQIYEFPCYCEFPEPPQLRIETPQTMLEMKLAGIEAYASQEQIALLVDLLRRCGAIEYIRELNFRFYSPTVYHPLFSRIA